MKGTPAQSVLSVYLHTPEAPLSPGTRTREGERMIRGRRGRRGDGRRGGKSGQEEKREEMMKEEET